VIFNSYGSDATIASNHAAIAINIPTVARQLPAPWPGSAMPDLRMAGSLSPFAAPTPPLPWTVTSNPGTATSYP